MAEYVHIGKIAATHGVGGEVLIVHSLGSRNSLKSVKALYIEQTKGTYIPYFLVAVTARNEEQTLIKLEGIDSKESAHRFLKKKLWLSAEDFGRIADKNAPISLLGYTIFNEGNDLGKVEEVIEQPHQVLLKTTFKEKEILVPVHLETLNGIDRKSKEVHVTLPDGLLAIYLEN